MADSRFFKAQGPFTAQAIAAMVGAELEHATSDISLRDVAPLHLAGAADVTFFDNPKYKKALQQCQAGAVIISQERVIDVPENVCAIVTPHPHQAYATVAQTFYPDMAVPKPVQHHAQTAQRLREQLVIIADSAIIGEGADIGAGSVIDHGAIIGAHVVLGKKCFIGAYSVIQYCVAGDQLICHPTVKIGQDGFGFAPNPAGHIKVPQLGRVVIGNQVDIGAGTCIDRGAGPDTLIGDGTKIDNLVQIGHNVSIGKGCFIVSQVGIAGSSSVGDFSVLAGQVGVAGHVAIGSQATLAAKSGVVGNVPDGATYGGIPAQPVRDWHKQNAWLRRQLKK